DCVAQRRDRSTRQECGATPADFPVARPATARPAADSAETGSGGGARSGAMKILQGFLTILIGGFATVGALLQTPAQAPRQPDIASLLPAGATLVLEAKDLSSLVGDWNGSAEKAKWLASDNYRAFSHSRLFLRLGEAYEEFGTAAG